MYIGTKQIGKLVYGNVSELEEKTVDLSMASGNQEVNATSGKSMSKVTVNKPSTMLPENIKKDIIIGGVTGSFEGGGGVDYFAPTVRSGGTSASGINGSITSIPSDMTISGTSAQYMFYNCTALTTIPLLDTSNVTTMRNMFSACAALTTIPLLNTSNVTDMQSMCSSCRALTTIPTLDTSNVTNMQNMFLVCSILTTIPLLNTSNVTDMTSMFASCTSLTTIPALNVSNVTNLGYMFYGCSNLESILMYGMKVSFNISASTKFTADALVTILDNLATVTTTQTLTMGTTNLAKLTQAQKDIAINKGWTLA